MEEFFYHKVLCVNRRLFCLSIRAGSALTSTCYSLLLLSVLGVNKCSVFLGGKKIIVASFYPYFPWQKLVFYLLLADMGYR